ncbi:MAG: PEP-CTERM sorting domain-containing protein [Desulfobacterales bacterium]|jgi:hypothetical protein|nr:PEP-CTERM sorting domain-containing protein [Desulfobacterales bacterium]
MKKLSMVLLTLFLVIGLSGTGNAALMGDLLNGTSITVGDKLFDNWAIEVLIDDAGTFDPTGIEVIGINDNPLNPGLSFLSNGAFYVEDGDWLDIEISFKVTVLNPSLFINGVTLDFSGIMTILGDATWGSLAIGEDIATDASLLSPFGGDVTSFDPWVEWDPGLGIQDYPDSANFNPLSEIWVRKDIFLISYEGGTVDLIDFTQHFSQTPVPEPSTMLLLGFGLVALGGYVRRKRQ